MKARHIPEAGAWLSLILLAWTQVAGAQVEQITGRWDVNVQGAEGTYPSWFEIRQSGERTLVGSFVGEFGSARPVSRIEFDHGRMRFAVPPQWEDRNDDQAFEGTLENQVLRGKTTDAKGKSLRWEARRAPALKRTGAPRWGQPVELFNGRDLTGWKPRDPGARSGWIVKDGMLVNEEPGNDLRTERRFTDFKLRAEFRYPRGSNSGIYLRGRYEVQIQDDFGQEPECHGIGAVYGFLTPSVNAAKEAGEWQTLEVALLGRQVTIMLNGERIVDRQIIPGITGGALDSNEGEPGPIMLQGDHGQVSFRSLTLIPADDH